MMAVLGTFRPNVSAGKLSLERPPSCVNSIGNSINSRRSTASSVPKPAPPPLPARKNAPEWPPRAAAAINSIKTPEFGSPPVDLVASSTSPTLAGAGGTECWAVLRFSRRCPLVDDASARDDAVDGSAHLVFIPALDAHRQQCWPRQSPRPFVQ
jgi:hypothetical protein